MNLTAKYSSLEDLPPQIPIFPLSGALLLPRAQLPLNIFEPRYLQMITDAMSSERLVGMVQPDSDDAEKGDENPSLYSVGCAGRITSYTEMPDGRFMATLTGVCRFRIANELSTTTPYRICQADFQPYRGDLDIGRGENSVDRERLVEVLRKYLATNRMDADWDEVEKATTESLVNTLCIIAPFVAAEKQALLEADSLGKRSEVLITLTEMGFADGASSDSTPSRLQ